MAHVIFYENPASAESAKQKARLVALGHEVDARDLTLEPWSVSSLRPYFGVKPVREWFNPAAPRVKSGEINLDSITPQSALVMMILDPTLINAPLMRVGSHCDAGFDVHFLANWMDVQPLVPRTH
jgi:nitrogenase-associated protein